MEPKTKLNVSKVEAARIRAAVQAVRTIEGENGSSRLATLADAPMILELLRDERVSGDVYTLPRPFSMDSISAWITDHQQQAKDGVGLLMVAEDEQGAIISITDVQFWPEQAACEFGGVIAAHMQNQHVGSKGVQSMCKWAFEDMGIRLIALTTSLTNIRSQKIVGHLGFTNMGEIDSVRPDGTVRRSLYWEMEA